MCVKKPVLYKVVQTYGQTTDGDSERLTIKEWEKVVITPATKARYITTQERGFL